MANLTEIEISCPECQYPNKIEVWSALNVHEDPELKDLLLGGEINMTECDSCHEFFYAEHFLLYHDPDNELLAFVYPFAYREEKARWEEKTRSDFALSQNTLEEKSRLSYEPISCFGLDELVSAVQWDEEVKIQGEIVSVLSANRNLEVRTLQPSLARRQKLPMVLPYRKDPSLSKRQAVLNALSDIEAVNDRLSIYQEARKRLLENAGSDIESLL